VHEPAGVSERERPQQECVDECEDGGIGPEREAQAARGGGEEAGGAPERAEGEAKVGQHRGARGQV
jgi:hypothetical protein